MFATHGEAFLPVFERLLPYFTRLLEPNRPWSDTQWGLCIFDDLIEYTGTILPRPIAYLFIFVLRFLLLLVSQKSCTFPYLI